MSKYTDEWLRQVDSGDIKDAEIIYKFGRLDGMTSNYAPVTSGGIYQTPITADSLELVSSSIEDASGGVGATSVVVEGIASDWTRQTEVIALNGTTPVNLTNTWLRVYRVRVVGSNTYATSADTSHVGVITLQEQGTGIVWATIDVEGGIGIGTSLIGNFTVPKGYIAYVIHEEIFMEAAKPVDIIRADRATANVVVAPYSPFVIEQLFYNATTSHDTVPRGLGKEMTGPYDMGYMAKSATSSATCAVNFEILLLKVY